MRRGSRTDIASRIGSVYLTSTGPDGAAGTATGLPVEFAWDDVHAHNALPGQTVRAAGGNWASKTIPAGEQREIVLLLTRYPVELYDALMALFATDAPRTCVLHHRTGSFTGQVKPNRNDPGPLSAKGDHPFTLGKGRELRVSLVANSWSAL